MSSQSQGILFYFSYTLYKGGYHIFENAFKGVIKLTLNIDLKEFI